MAMWLPVDAHIQLNLTISLDISALELAGTAQRFGAGWSRTSTPICDKVQRQPHHDLRWHSFYETKSGRGTH